MSGRGARRRQRRRPDAAAGGTREADRSRPGTSPGAAPRRSALPVIFALLAGLFLGRVLTTQLGGSGLLGAIDLAMYAGLAAVIAVAFRRWARRNVEERRRQQLRRRRARGEDQD